MKLARYVRGFAYDFTGRVAIITGGSRGLGLVLARTLADRGARLAVVARDELEIQRAVRDLSQHGAEVAGLAAERLGRVPFDPELAALCDRGWPPEEAAAAGGAALAAIDEIAVRLAPAAETRSRAPHPEVRE
jgi:NAD(P)-dependent dehydrogenase (short-subunit alcohol dehydrogenase family)